MLIRRNWQRFAVLIALCASGCTPLDVTAALGISGMTTGWLDVGLDDLGRNKLVPTISFSLTNRSSQRVRTLQLNGVFRRCAVLYGDEQPDTVSPVRSAKHLMVREYCKIGGWADPEASR